MQRIFPISSSCDLQKTSNVGFTNLIISTKPVNLPFVTNHGYFIKPGFFLWIGNNRVASFHHKRGWFHDLLLVCLSAGPLYLAVGGPRNSQRIGLDPSWQTGKKKHGNLQQMWQLDATGKPWWQLGVSLRSYQNAYKALRWSCFFRLIWLISSYFFKILEFRLEVEKDYRQRHVFIRKNMLR